MRKRGVWGNRGYRRLWAARVVSFLGDSMGLVALLLLVSRGADRAFAVALLLLAGDLVPTAVAPLAGALSDRLEPRRLMVGCELAQGGLVLAIAVTSPPLVLLLGLVAARATLAQIFAPASRSVVPTLVGTADLEQAYAGLGFGTYGLDVAGPVLAAVTVPLVGVRGVLVGDAVTFGVSALLLRGLPSAPRLAREPGGAGLLREARAGLSAVAGHPVLLPLTVGFCAVVAFNGVDDVALGFLGRDVLQGGESGASLLYGASGLGLLFGFAVLARIRPGVAARLLVAGFALSSLGNLATGLAWAVWVAAATQLVRGVGISLIEVGSNSLIARTVPSALRGRAFANVYGAVGVAAGVSYLLGGLLLDFAGPRTTFVVAGLGGLVSTALAAPLLTRRAAADPAG